MPNANIHSVPGNQEYGDVNDADQPPLSNGSNYFTKFGPSGLNELPPSVTGSGTWLSAPVSQSSATSQNYVAYISNSGPSNIQAATAPVTVSWP